MNRVTWKVSSIENSVLVEPDSKSELDSGNTGQVITLLRAREASEVALTRDTSGPSIDE